MVTALDLILSSSAGSLRRGFDSRYDLSFFKSLFSFLH